ncbi:hypothetical protein J3Q64DRAFT_1697717 [Phycomyces blakesleeanus]|uniref:Uncharacterized protein n=1 Tax=Phycomyces blakesleeanus TaxID=4837 RepID=A0ABR3B349_PHYBL
MPTMNDRSFSIITGRLNPPYLARQDAFQVDEHENVVCVAPIERPRRKKMPVRVAMLGLCLYLFLVWDLCKCVGMKKLPGELFPPNQRGERVEYLWIPTTDRTCWSKTTTWTVLSLILWIGLLGTVDFALACTKEWLHRK